MTNNILVDYEANSHENAVVYAQIPRYGTGLGLGTRNSLATTNVDLSQVWTRPRYYRRLQSGSNQDALFLGTQRRPRVSRYRSRSA